MKKKIYMEFENLKLRTILEFQLYNKLNSSYFKIQYADQHFTSKIINVKFPGEIKCILLEANNKREIISEFKFYFYKK